MPETPEYRELKEALKRANTPADRKAAADAMRRYNATRKTKGQGSNPILVSLGAKKPYPTAIRVEDIPEELERNPAFYDHMKKVIK